MERFTVDIPEAVLEDLHLRLDAPGWTDDFANKDWRYGANASYMHELADYWRHGYDWRARERLMNGFAHIRTTLQGMLIHFIHERGQGPAPIPVILNHGWPWSFWDFS
jgi:Epoxide hydrolase N terminus